MERPQQEMTQKRDYETSCIYGIEPHPATIRFTWHPASSTPGTPQTYTTLTCDTHAKHPRRAAAGGDPADERQASRPGIILVSSEPLRP